MKQKRLRKIIHELRLDGFYIKIPKIFIPVFVLYHAHFMFLPLEDPN